MINDESNDQGTGGDAGNTGTEVDPTRLTEVLSRFRIYSDADTEAAKAAMTRLHNWLDTPAYVTDDKGYVVCSNDIADDAQSFIRDYLDQPEADISGDNFYYEHLTRELAQGILNDLALIWGYEFYRDDISHMAMTMSLCPLHFCDWAACFDDDDVACEQIRRIFPHHHDT